MPGKREKPDRDELIERALRPCPLLGYNRDHLGMYFMGREAFELAESQFRHAASVNPYEPAFKVHWALALYQLDRIEPAQDLLAEVLQAQPDHADAQRLLQLCHSRQHQQQSVTPPTTQARSA